MLSTFGVEALVLAASAMEFAKRGLKADPDRDDYTFLCEIRRQFKKPLTTGCYISKYRVRTGCLQNQNCKNK